MFIQLSIAVLTLIVPEIWKDTFEGLRRSQYWRFIQIAVIIWIVVVVWIGVFPSVIYWANRNRTFAVIIASAIGAIIFGTAVWYLITPPSPVAQSGVRAKTKPTTQPFPISNLESGYAYGLALQGLNVGRDDQNPRGYVLQLGLILQNVADGPLKYEVESINLNVGGIHPINAWTNGGGVIPRGATTIFYCPPFDKKITQARAEGTLEYAIKYGHPEQGFFRVSRKKLHITLRLDQTTGLVYQTESESDERITPATAIPETEKNIASASPPAAAMAVPGEIGWNFSSFLGMTGEGTQARVHTFQTFGRNIWSSTITKIEGYVEIDGTGERFPLFLNKEGKAADLAEMPPIEIDERTEVVCYFTQDRSLWGTRQGGIESNSFLDRYTPFTLVVSINGGKEHKYPFSTENCKALIQAFVNHVRPPAANESKQP